MSLSEPQRRFLSAYSQQPQIAPAARAAGVHRASVYRWRRDEAFVAAMKAAYQAWYAGHLVRVKIAETARAEQRRRREAELRPMKARNLEKARAARRRRW